MIGMNERAPVTIPGWCSRCFQPCPVALGVNEPLCPLCAISVEHDRTAGLVARRRYRRRLA